MAKRNPSKSEVRRMRTQQIIFSIIAILMIVVMVIGLISR